jgi:tetratricopeptide (TPR) repeat protein
MSDCGMHNIVDLFNLAVQYHQGSDLARAEPLYRQILQSDPNHVSVLNNLAALLLKRGQLDEAIACLRLALRVQPDYAMGHINLGNALKDRGQWSEAVQSYRQAARIAPHMPEAHYNLGNALLEEGNFVEAGAAFRQALLINPDHAETHYNLGNALGCQGLLAEASASYRQAIRLRPNYVDAHINLGNVLKDQRRFAEGTECYRQAMRVAAESDAGQRMALWNLSCLRLLLGDYEGAWPGYEQRWTEHGSEQGLFQQPRWHGKNVLVTSEHAFGDTIQFARYLPLIQREGGNVFLGCHPALFGLMTGILGAHKVVPARGPWPPSDIHIQLLSLPGIFGTTLATVPAEVPYLKPDSQRVVHWSHEISSGASGSELKIGIVWQGSMTIKGDRRSCSLSQFEGLAQVPGVRLVSLQVGPGTEQIASFPFPVMDLGSHFDRNSLADLAAAMVNLDLIITVDTAAAHLAGALAVPVWTLLSYVPDWRWLLDREDSPWYPTMRLFRQNHWGDWSDVFERIAAAFPSFSPISQKRADSGP